MKNNAVVVIPAHLSSKRLPRKVFANIDGIPMLKRVLIQCSQAVSLDDMCVATPDKEIYDKVIKWGYKCYMSALEANSGTSAIASIIDKLDAQYIINVQGDQPLIPPAIIKNIINILFEIDEDVLTPVYSITKEEDIKDIGVAKVVRDINGKALYFSRSPIPNVVNSEKKDLFKGIPFWGHYGIYGYKKEVLRNLHNLNSSYLESAEKLEQLRFLQNGLSIYTFETTFRQLAADTQQDLEKIEYHLKNNKYEKQ